MQPDTYYHYFNRANNREQLFVDDENYRYFLLLLKKYIPPVANVYSYCLLPNHFHMVIKTKAEHRLPENVQSGERLIRHSFSNLFNAYAKAFNKRHNRRGSLFQKHPKHIEIDNTSYLREVLLYVNNNAGHHNIAEPEKYAHSSYHALLSCSNTMLERDAVIELFGSKEELENCLLDKNRRIELAQAAHLENEE